MRYYTLLIAALCTVFFAVQSFIPGFTDTFVNSDAIARPWTLVTSIFLHGSFSHLAFNMFALVLFGLILEGNIGSKKFLAVFFVSGIAASIAASLVYSSSLGASGAIYGIIGALAAIRPKMIVWAYGVPMPMVAAAAFYLLLDLGGMFFPSDVANAAHIAGLLVGAIIGISLRKGNNQERKIRAKNVSEKEFEEWEDRWM